MTSQDQPTFKERNRVEYVGPVRHEEFLAMPGDRGTIVTRGSLGESPREWLVNFDLGPVGVYSEDELRLIE